MSYELNVMPTLSYCEGMGRFVRFLLSFIKKTQFSQSTFQDFSHKLIYIQQSCWRVFAEILRSFFYSFCYLLAHIQNYLLALQTTYNQHSTGFCIENETNFLCKILLQFH